MNAVTEMPSPLIFTDNAAKKVKELIDEEGSPDLKLRVFVSGGGCSGEHEKTRCLEVFGSNMAGHHSGLHTF